MLDISFYYVKERPQVVLSEGCPKYTKSLQAYLHCKYRNSGLWEGYPLRRIKNVRSFFVIETLLSICIILSSGIHPWGYSLMKKSVMLIRKFEVHVIRP